MTKRKWRRIRGKVLERYRDNTEMRKLAKVKYSAMVMNQLIYAFYTLPRKF